MLSLLLELAAVVICHYVLLSLQGYGDHKPKSSTAAQEVKTLDGIFSEQVRGPRLSLLFMSVVSLLSCVCPCVECWKGTALSRRKAEECWPVPGEVPGAVVTHCPLPPYWDCLPLARTRDSSPSR